MRGRLAIILTMAGLVTGCAPRPQPVTEPLPRLQLVETLETESDRLLDYYAYMIELQGDALLREYHNVQKQNAANPSEFNRMQLVMLLSSPSAPFRDIKLAQSTLREWLNDDYYRYSKLRPLVLLYYNDLSELDRQTEIIDETTDKLRLANELNANRALELEAALANSKELQQKLDALLEMERNLIDRQQINKPETP